MPQYPCRKSRGGGQVAVGHPLHTHTHMRGDGLLVRAAALWDLLSWGCRPGDEADFLSPLRCDSRELGDMDVNSKLGSIVRYVE